MSRYVNRSGIVQTALPLFWLMIQFAPAQAHALWNTYDSLNRLTQVEYADGTIITYIYDAAGNRLSEVVDTLDPTVRIESPTVSDSYTTNNASIDLGGTATDDIGIADVIWTNDRGGSGTVTATTSWSVASIPLQIGTNVLTVTVRDAAGKTGTDILTVTYELPSPTDTPTTTPITSPAGTATRTPTITPTPTATATVAPTATPSHASTSTPTRTPTPTATASGTATSSPTPTPTASGDISGRIRYYSADRPVAGATVHLSGCTDQTTVTDQSGRYAFFDVPAGACHIEASKVDTSKDGISALDAAYVLQEVVGLRNPAFDSFQQLAGDVTGNGTISALDAARILQGVVGIISRFPVASSCTSDWAFWPMRLSDSNETVIPPVVSPGACQPGAVDFTPLSPPATGQDFYGIKFGDCTGNWQPPGEGGSAAALLSAESPRVSLGRPRPGRSGRLRVPVYVQTTTPFQALELELTHDSLELHVATARVARSAPGALVRFDSDAAGRVKVALASATPIDADAAPVLHLELEPLDGPARDRLELRSALVDDHPAEIE